VIKCFSNLIAFFIAVLLTPAVKVVGVKYVGVRNHLSVSLVGGTPCPSLPMQITAANFHCQQYFAK
jgi:hypothetical protein